MNIIPDVDTSRFFPSLAQFGSPLSFLVPSSLAYREGLIDATGPVRQFLRFTEMKDCFCEEKGLFYNTSAPSFFVTDETLIQTEGFIYNKLVEKEKNQLWFDQLQEYCRPYNLLALVANKQKIYVMNLSEQKIAESLLEGGFVKELLTNFSSIDNMLAGSLLERMKEISAKGFLRSTLDGAPGVGDTLERELGIFRNCSKEPDYKGIEIKTVREKINGKKTSSGRSTLFAKTPEEGLKSRKILEKYGKVQTPHGKTEARLQIYDTLRVSRPNSYGLYLKVDEEEDKLHVYHRSDGGEETLVSSWSLDNLRRYLVRKHKETFWVYANTEKREDGEYFHYTKVRHTRNPNITLFEHLLNEDKITVDFAMHFDAKTNKIRDHGILFKVAADAIHPLMGFEQEYSLE